MMTPYELTNTQRQYFGLFPVMDSWERQILNDSVTVYFDGNTIVKILNHNDGYIEYDTDIQTTNREMLLPITSKGKIQKLTVPKLLKIMGLGIQFHIAAAAGGGISVFDNKHKRTLIESFPEDGPISNFQQANDWIENYIKDSLSDYFEWLKQKLTRQDKKQEAKPGDIIAFKVGRYEYGFARIIKGILKRKDFDLSNPINNYLIHPHSLTVATYAFTSDKLLVDINKLILKESLPSIYLFDFNVCYGETPIIGHRPLSQKDIDFPLPNGNSTYLTIHYSKTDIHGFIKDNNFTNNLE